MPEVGSKQSGWILIITVLLGLSSCASQGRYALDVPLSEASEMAASDNPAERTLSASPVWSAVGEVSVEIASTWVQRDRRSMLPSACEQDAYACPENRLLLGRRYGVNFGPNQYQLLNGYQLQWSLREQQARFNFVIGYQPVAFSGDAGQGKKNPDLVSLELGMQWLPVTAAGPVSLAVGGQFSTSVLYFQYQNPLTINGHIIAHDSLNIFSLGVPMGIIFDQGMFSVETSVTPTLSFHDDRTEVGFRNDTFTVHRSVPVAVSFGFRW